MKSPGPLEKRLRFIVVLVQVVLVSVGARSVPGWTAHLLCSCLQDKDILGMMITTPDLPENEYCFFIRDGREDTTNQNAAFIERLSWTGGPNVTMKEVTSSDAVPYTCKGLYKGPRDDPKETSCPATLTVQGGPTPRPPGPPDGGIFKNLPREIALIILFAVIVVTVVVIVVKRREIRIYCTKTEEKRDAPVKFYHDKVDGSSEDEDLCTKV